MPLFTCKTVLLCSLAVLDLRVDFHHEPIFTPDDLLRTCVLPFPVLIHSMSECFPLMWFSVVLLSASTIVPLMRSFLKHVRKLFQILSEAVFLCRILLQLFIALFFNCLIQYFPADFHICILYDLKDVIK